jgi:nitrogen regulatory protein P-II 2
MNLKTLKLVTIISEAIISDKIIREIQGLGAKGYTATGADGQGSRGVRASEWEGKNVRIEVIAHEQVAEKILTLLAEYYFPNYAVIAFVQDVGVVRGDKYV